MATHELVVKPGYRLVINVTFGSPQWENRVRLQDYISGVDVGERNSRTNGNGAIITPENTSSQVKLYLLHAEHRSLGWFHNLSKTLFQSEFNVFYAFEDGGDSNYNDATANVSFERVS